MQNQKENASGGKYIFIGLLVGAIVIALICFISYTSYYNSAVRMESQIENLNKNSENVLSSVTTNIKEQAGVTNIYSEDFQNSLKIAMSGRYGEKGSGAAMQWIKENNPQLDSKLYIKIQDVIDGGRKEFQLSQTNKLNTCRDYKNQLGYFWGGSVLKFAGFPRIKLDDVCEIVSDAQSRSAFTTHLNEPTKLR